MSKPRQIADRLTEGVVRGDLAMVMSCYSPDAVAVAPEGRFEGRAEVEGYWKALFDAYSDVDVVVTTKLDSGDSAMDEWVWTGTHTGPVELPNGETLPATGTRLTVRGADLAVIPENLITEHRFYYDQTQFVDQLREARV